MTEAKLHKQLAAITERPSPDIELKLKPEATRSNCCQSPMRVAVEGTTHWHECVKCGQACDPEIER